MWKKNCRTRQATNEKMAQVHCMPYNYDYKHTLRISNAHCCSTATMVGLTNLMLRYKCTAYLVSSTNDSLLRFGKKVKAIPLQAWTGPEGSRRMMFPDIKTIGT